MGKTNNSGIAHGTGGSPQGTIEQGNLTNKVSELARKQMVQPLIDANVKFTEKDVLFVTKDKTNQTIWLETGNEKGGLKHILDGNGTKESPGHANQFMTVFNIGREQVSNLLNKIMSNGSIYSNSLKMINGRQGYERIYEYNGKYVLVTGIGTNGFIVSAYPTKKPGGKK